jgi:hypothetical protein
MGDGWCSCCAACGRVARYAAGRPRSDMRRRPHMPPSQICWRAGSARAVGVQIHGYTAVSSFLDTRGRVNFLHVEHIFSFFFTWNSPSRAILTVHRRACTQAHPATAVLAVSTVCCVRYDGSFIHTHFVLLLPAASTGCSRLSLPAGCMLSVSVCCCVLPRLRSHTAVSCLSVFLPAGWLSVPLCCCCARWLVGRPGVQTGVLPTSTVPIDRYPAP